jgi:hypothetical protein
VTPKDAGPAAEAAGGAERDTPMTGIYVRALLLEAVIVVALWYFGKMFS